MTPAQAFLRENILSPVNQAILTAWPEVTKVFSVTQLKRRNWSNLINEGLTAPLVVLDVQRMRPSSMGASDALCFKMTISATYVTWGGVEVGGNAPDGDLFSNLAEVGLQLAMTLTGAEGALPFTLDSDSFEIDATDAGAVMSSMLDANMPLDAVNVTFEILTGVRVPEATLVALPT